MVVLPCGSGKTIVGLAAIAAQRCETLIVTSNSASLAQWRGELEARTTVAPEAIGEYSSQAKEIRPITLTTYQMLTHRPRRDAGFPHLDLFERREWGLVIYDEVHLLPAPVFRATARIQARRRLGLTATLVREDGAEPLVFSLVGPKRYDMAWRELEDAGWIASAECTEVRVPLAAQGRMDYALADARERFGLASRNPAKDALVTTILRRHPGAQALVIGYFVGQLARIAQSLSAPLITGKTPRHEREAALRALPRRRDRGAVCQQGRQLRARPAVGERRGRGLGHVRLSPGGGAAARPPAAAEARREPRVVLHARLARDDRAGLRAPPPAVPGRAGIPLHGAGSGGVDGGADAARSMSRRAP